MGTNRNLRRLLAHLDIKAVHHRVREGVIRFSPTAEATPSESLHRSLTYRVQLKFQLSGLTSKENPKSIL